MQLENFHNEQTLCSPDGVRRKSLSEFIKFFFFLQFVVVMVCARYIRRAGFRPVTNSHSFSYVEPRRDFSVREWSYSWKNDRERKMKIKIYKDLESLLVEGRAAVYLRACWSKEAQELVSAFKSVRLSVYTDKNNDYETLTWLMKTESLTLHSVVVNAVEQHYKFMKGVLGVFVFFTGMGGPHGRGASPTSTRCGHTKSKGHEITTTNDGNQHKKPMAMVWLFRLGN